MRVYWRRSVSDDLPRSLGGTFGGVFVDTGDDTAALISDGCLRFEHGGTVWTVPLDVVAAIEGTESALDELEQLARLRFASRDTPKG